MWEESFCCKKKENHSQRRGISVAFARCPDFSECTFELLFIRPMASSLMCVCTSDPISPYVDIARGRRKYAPGNELLCLLFLRSTVSTRLFPAWFVAFSRLVLTLESTMVISSSSALSLRWGITAEEWTRLRSHIHPQESYSTFCPYPLCWTGHIYSIVK